MIRKYILVDHEPVEVSSIEEWGRWFQHAGKDRIVDRTELPGGVKISTVFVGVDAAYDGRPPQIFESMIFGGPHDGEMNRCATWDEAVHMHRAMCILARTGLTQAIAGHAPGR